MPADSLPVCLVAIPLAGALLVAALPGAFHAALRLTAGLVSLWPLWLALRGFHALPAESVASLPWIPAWGIRFHLGFDGLGGPLALLTAALTPIVILSTWRQVSTRVKGFLVCLLLLESGLFVTFMARDLFLFYCGWELVLIPMYFIVGLWGGARRIYATMKFVLFTAAGSLLMLAAILALARANGRWDFSAETCAAAARTFSPEMQRWLLLAFIAAFAVKVPVWPFHTWLPDAHVEAPAGGSIFLAGVLLKMGTYGMLRFAFPLFPEAAREILPWILALGAIGAVWGGLMSLAQGDIKSLVAYSSVSHMAVIVLGISSLDAAGVAGALFQMVAHGVNTGCLFLLVGMLYERTHSRLVADHGGLAKAMPAFTVFFVVACLSSLGLPGLAGFPGEFLILKGLLASWMADRSNATMAAFVATGAGLLLSASYLLWMVKRVFFGPLHHPGDHVPEDLSIRERTAAGILVVTMVVLGLAPGIVTGRAEPAIRTVLAAITRGAP